MTDKTEAPERVWVEPYWPADNWGHCSDGKVGDDDEPFIREDVANALVAAAYDAAGSWIAPHPDHPMSDWTERAHVNASLARMVRALTPADARAALDSLIAEAVEACALIAEHRHKEWNHPDTHGKPEVTCDVTACKNIAAAIRARKSPPPGKG